MTEYVGEIVGQCPRCKKGNLTYGKRIESDGEHIYYPFKCDDCGLKGKEWYYVEFTEIVGSGIDTNKAEGITEGDKSG